MQSKKFKETLKESKERTDLEILRFFSERKNNPGKILKEYDLLEHFLMNGGKRLRPIILQKTYEGFGGGKNIVRESLSIELLHNATLIEDDVMDEDIDRRGKPTVCKIFIDKHKKQFGEKKYKGEIFNRESSRVSVTNSILLANILYSLGLECITKSNFAASKITKCADRFNESFIKVNEGQFLDMKFEKQRIVTEEEYIHMVELKSSEIVMAAADIGGILAGANKKRIKAISEFFKRVIVAFQIRDDLMDVDSNSKKGHETGSDIKQGKKTLMVIKALEKVNSKDKKILIKNLGNNKASKKDISKAIGVLSRTGAIKYCQELAEQKVENSKQWLKKAKLRQEEENFFELLADYVVKRNI